MIRIRMRLRSLFAQHELSRCCPVPIRKSIRKNGRDGCEDFFQFHFCRFESILTLTGLPLVSAAINYDEFPGTGNVLHVFNVADKTCQFFTVLRQQRIHGIRFQPEFNLVAVYGNREIAVASFGIDGTAVSLAIVDWWIVGDWICDVKWSKDADELIILAANNIVSAWKWKNRALSRSIKCRDKCLLFCGIIQGTDWSDTIAMCGTMFRSILIWAPSKAVSGETCGVLHKLTGHKGAIFSMFYHEKSRRICSTSDDRSVRMWMVNFPAETVAVLEAWNRAEIVPLFSVYGHVSRVWKSFILDDLRFVSAGEDSQLRVWSKNGKPLLAWETHQGASIRSLDVCENQKVMVTGGKDGGVSLWPLHATNQTAEVAFGDELNFRHSRDVPRRLLLAKSGNLLTTTDEGKLLVYSKTVWLYVHHDRRFASYCLFDVSPSRTYFSWASLRGDVKIFEETKDKSLVTVIFDGRICDGKIFSLHWLSDTRFITCCADGKLEIWDLSSNSDRNQMCKVGEYILPSCKERWLTSAVEFENQIIVGDREGSVHVFGGDKLPRQTFRRVHGRLGVSGISCSNRSEFYSIGRDGFIRHWRCNGTAIEHMAADKLPVKWPVRVLTSHYGLLVLGFNETNFEVWNVKERKQLFAYKCGGGHRPWDFVIEGQALFVYIREKTVCSVFLPSDRLTKPSYLEGFHIRDTVCIRFLEENLIISGGEDTTLRLSKITAETRIHQPVSIIRSHISSIRAITFLRVDDFILVVSAGGRAQLKVWKLITSEDTIKYSELASHMLKPSNKSRKPWINMIHTFELEPRHMDLQVERSGQTDFLIYAAGSDAFWRIYTFNLTTKSLQLLEEIEYPNYCILKLLLIEWRNRKFTITFATDGRATFWNTNNYSITYQHALHQSGINGYAYTMVDDRLVLVTGGDDASLVATVFENVDEEIKIKGQWKNSSVHEAQISGIGIVDNHIISVGADQKVVLWQWELTHETIRVDLKTFQHSFVPDIHGLDISPSKKYVCVFGAGFEVLSVNV